MRSRTNNAKIRGGQIKTVKQSGATSQQNLPVKRNVVESVAEAKAATAGGENFCAQQWIHLLVPQMRADIEAQKIVREI